MDYYFVAQGKTTIPNVDDGEECTLTDVRPITGFLVSMIEPLLPHLTQMIHDTGHVARCCLADSSNRPLVLD